VEELQVYAPYSERMVNIGVTVWISYATRDLMLIQQNKFY